MVFVTYSRYYTINTYNICCIYGCWLKNKTKQENGGIKMKQNNRKNTWKAIVAVMLVMATLFSISTMVSANFVELLFNEEYSVMTSSSSKANSCIGGIHDWNDLGVLPGSSTCSVDSMHGYLRTRKCFKCPAKEIYCSDCSK